VSRFRLAVGVMLFFVSNLAFGGRTGFREGISLFLCWRIQRHGDRPALGVRQRSL